MTSQEGAEAAPAPEQQEEQVALSPEAPEPSAPNAAQTDSEAAEGGGYVDSRGLQLVDHAGRPAGSPEGLGRHLGCRLRKTSLSHPS